LTLRVAERRKARFVGRHAAPDVVLDLELQVQRELFIQIAPTKPMTNPNVSRFNRQLPTIFAKRLYGDRGENFHSTAD